LRGFPKVEIHATTSMAFNLHFIARICD